MNNPMTDERLAEIRSRDDRGLIIVHASEDISELLAEVDRLRALIHQVDDVLTVNWIAHDGADYRKALHDLVSQEIRIHDDPRVSQSASDRETERAELLKDRVRLDWIENFIETGVLESAFELDGGIHVTLSTIGDSESVAYREKNSFRDAIDAAAQEDQKCD